MAPPTEQPEQQTRSGQCGQTRLPGHP